MSIVSAQPSKPFPAFRKSRANAMPTVPLRDKALVLKTSKCGESDRVVTLLTEKHGLVRLVAKGVRKTTSRFGARLELFMYCDVLWTQPGGWRRSGSSPYLGTVSQAELLRSYGARIVKGYDDYVAAGIIAETACLLNNHDSFNGVEYYRLTHGAFAALARRAHRSELIAGSYLVRALGIAGWSISLRLCAQCSSPDSSWFSAALGGVVCRRCRPAAAVACNNRTIRLLTALACGDWSVADAAEADVRFEAFALAAQCVAWHLGSEVKSFRALPRKAVRFNGASEAVSASKR